MKKLLLTLLLLNCVGCSSLAPDFRSCKAFWNRYDEEFVRMTPDEQSSRDVGLFRTAHGPSAYVYTHHHLQPNSFWVLDQFGQVRVFMSIEEYRESKEQFITEPQYAIKPLWWLDASYGVDPVNNKIR